MKPLTAAFIGALVVALAVVGYRLPKVELKN